MSIPTKTQVSSGGVIFRQIDEQVDIALIAVAGSDETRWQLPKGIVGRDEEPEEAALREVREETGLDAQMVGPIETIEYWYYGSGGKVRFHKYVHFYLLSYKTGSTSDHDHEVLEARWVALEQAVRLLAFKNEQKVVQQAGEMIKKLP